MERLQEMATHGLIVHPTQPDYLTCGHHFRKGNHICWSGAKHLEAHFDAKHKRLYERQNAGERMATTEEICPSIDAPLSGVWADPVLLRPTAMPMDPMAMPRDPTAMPGPTAALQQDEITRAHGYGKLSSGDILRCGGLMHRQWR